MAHNHRPRSSAFPHSGESNMARSTILVTATRILLPLMLLFAFYIFVRGHNDPGGGFIGGLIAATAFSLYGIANGMNAARALLRVHPRMLIGVGLLCVVVSGLVAPLLFGEPFLTAKWSTVVLPAFGKLGTPLLFDTGVFLGVIGVTSMIIFTLAEEG